MDDKIRNTIRTRIIISDVTNELFPARKVLNIKSGIIRKSIITKIGKYELQINFFILFIELGENT